MAQIFFPKFNRLLVKTSERWENPYTVSSTRRQGSADVGKVQCTHCEGRESIVRAQRITMRTP